MTKTVEYENCDRTIREILKTPHGEIKEKLDQEKARKKRKTPKKSCISGHAPSDRA